MNINMKNYIRPYPTNAIGVSAFLALFSSVGAWVCSGSQSVPLQPEPTVEEDKEEMKKWSSSLPSPLHPSHKNFNPFEWNHTPDEFAN